MITSVKSHSFILAHLTPRFSFSHSTDLDPALAFSSSLSSLQDYVQDIQAKAYAPSTLWNLRSQWKVYLHFCHCFHLTPLPTSASTVSCFLAYLSRTTTSFEYVMNQLNSICLLHLHNGFACEALNSFPVVLTEKGLKRIMGTKSRQKHPITVDLLRRMRTVFDLSIPTQAALWCLFLVAFFSFL